MCRSGEYVQVGRVSAGRASMCGSLSAPDVLGWTVRTRLDCAYSVGLCVVGRTAGKRDYQEPELPPPPTLPPENPPENPLDPPDPLLWGTCIVLDISERIEWISSGE